MIALQTPDVRGLTTAVQILRDWQRQGAPVQLHPGDLGWHWSFGAGVTAGDTRTWSRDGELLAVGLLDSPDVLRLAVAPGTESDDLLAEALVADLTLPEHGVLAAGEAAVEARSATRLRELLRDAGWEDGEPWTPLTRDLAEPLERSDLQVEVVAADRADSRVAVHRAAFQGSTFTGERWQAMVSGPAYADARCLLGLDEAGAAVAAATVWSAGPGRPGLLEPVGVHRDHRGKGYGTAITLAAAQALRDLGSSSATVCTRAANAVAVAAYRSAGFRQHADAHDVHRAG